MAVLTLYYDVVSPWSMIAYTVLQRYRTRWNANIVLKPMFLGGIMVASGNKPPITVKNKGLWMNGKDLPLAAKFYELEYKHPESFPVNTIHCMRVLRAVEDKLPDRLEKATELFFDAVWRPSSGKTANDAITPSTYPTLLKALFSDSEIKQLLEHANSEEIKGKLKSESKQLVEEGGAFGFPWIVAQRDDGAQYPFFGSDRFEQIAFWLGKEWEGPVPGRKDAGKVKL
ncbi:uncharacterized protein JCM10292_003537 [Rhodotorula paludigena]|uniref:uncharacterized protein n=1 Tax=Rhodotorula paludigena TaxID=86838 RepID=UPI003178F9A8